MVLNLQFVFVSKSSLQGIVASGMESAASQSCSTLRVKPDTCSSQRLLVLWMVTGSREELLDLTLRSGQLNSSKTDSKSSMAPSVISMMAWLHMLP